jgi:hypothetical protein
LTAGFLAAGFLAADFLVAHLPRVAHLEVVFLAAGFLVVFTVFFAMAIVSSPLFDWRRRPWFRIRQPAGCIALHYTLQYIGLQLFFSRECH